MVKKIIAIIILSVLLHILYPYADKDKTEVYTEPTNFVEDGFLSFDSTGNKQDTPYFSYKTDLLAPTTTVELTMDESSVCVTRGGALPCLAMSVLWHVPFGGKRAVVEAYETLGEVRVRVLRMFEEDGMILYPGKGVVYIPWPKAVELIDECRVKLIMQAHNLNVGLELKDGDRVTAIEPTIDEVFKVYNQSKERCGNVPIATE